MDLRILTVTGRLGKDVEAKHAASGTVYAKVSIAVTVPKKSQSGDYEYETIWVSATMFGKSAERASEFFRKGQLVHATGNFNIRMWEGKPQIELDMASVSHVLSKKQQAMIDAGADGNRAKARTEDEEDNVPF